MKSRLIDPALQRRAAIEQRNPYGNQQQIFLAKVIAVHPDTGTVDVALDGTPYQGGFYDGVPVLSWSYGTQTGQTYMPGNIAQAAPVPSSQGTYDQPIPSGEQDVWAIIAHLGGRAQRPVCIGFMSPNQSQVHTTDPGYDVKLHESGVYTVIDPSGKVQIGLPDGSTIVVGTNTTPIDMTTQNADWKPQTTTSAYSVALNIKGSVAVTVVGDATIDTTGNVYLGTTTGGGAAVARVGDTVTNGIIASGSSKVFSG